MKINRICVSILIWSFWGIAYAGDGMIIHLNNSSSSALKTSTSNVVCMYNTSDLDIPAIPVQMDYPPQYLETKKSDTGFDNCFARTSKFDLEIQTISGEKIDTMSFAVENYNPLNTKKYISIPLENSDESLYVGWNSDSISVEEEAAKQQHVFITIK